MYGFNYPKQEANIFMLWACPLPWRFRIETMFFYPSFTAI